MKFKHLVRQSSCLRTPCALASSLLDRRISPIINIKDDDSKMILKYPVPNRKVKMLKKYVSQNVFPSNGPQTMTSIKKTQTAHTHTYEFVWVRQKRHGITGELCETLNK